MTHNQKAPPLDDATMNRRHEVIRAINRMVDGIDEIVDRLEESAELSADELVALDRLRDERARLEETARDVADDRLYDEWKRVHGHRVRP